MGAPQAISGGLGRNPFAGLDYLPCNRAPQPIRSASRVVPECHLRRRSALRPTPAPRYWPAVMARSLTLLFLLAVPGVGSAQGKLDQVRDAVDCPDPPAAPSRDKDDTCDDSSSSGSCDPSIWDGPGGGGSGGVEALALYAVAAPWMLPHAALDPGLRVDGKFTPYPYAEPPFRHVALPETAENGAPTRDRSRLPWWSGRASAEAGSDFSGLDRVGLRLFLDTDTRFGLKTDWDWYSEKLPCGCRDELWLGDLTATFRFVQNEWLVMHTGVGARFLVDHGRDRAGVNFLYGFDAFPAKPVHLFGSAEAGTLGSAGVYRLRGGVGVNWSHVELFAGYDFVRIGGVNLQGPMAGLRLWF